MKGQGCDSDRDSDSDGRSRGKGHRFMRAALQLPFPNIQVKLSIAGSPRAPQNFGRGVGSWGLLCNPKMMAVLGSSWLSYVQYIMHRQCKSRTGGMLAVEHR